MDKNGYLDVSVHFDNEHDFNSEAVQMESRTQNGGLIGMKNLILVQQSNDISILQEGGNDTGEKHESVPCFFVVSVCKSEKAVENVD